MRIHSLIHLGSLVLLTAGCQDARPAPTAPDPPLQTVLSREIHVRAGTFERHIPGGTWFASYSGGRVDVSAVAGGTTTPLGNVHADWGPAETFTEPTGGYLRLAAHAYSGCTFSIWRIGVGTTTSISNPIDTSSYPGATEFRAEFTCTVN